MIWGTAARALVAAIFLLVSIRTYAIDSGYSGSWYNPAQSGHGITVEVLNPSLAAVTWYVYDGQGNQAWLIGVGQISGNQISAPMSITNGMQFGTFNTATKNTLPWGTVTLNFSSCSNATMSWQSTYQQNGFTFGNGNTTLTRLTGIDSVKCGKRPASGLYNGLILSAAQPQGVPVTGLLDETGQLTFLQTDGGAIYLGTYSGSGSAVTLTATGYAAPGFTFPNGATTASVTISGQGAERDFITGAGTGGGASATVTLHYNPTYDRPSSPAAVAGTYTWSGNGNTVTITVSSTGVLSGTDTNACQYQGTVTPINTQFDGYAVTAAIDNCGAANGTYTGVGVIVDYGTYGDNKALVLGVRGPAAVLVRTFVRQ